MDDAELGRTIKRTIKEGYTMTLTPQISDRVFATLECNAQHKERAARLPDMYKCDSDTCVAVVTKVPYTEQAVIQGTSPHLQPRTESRAVDIAGRSYRVEYYIGGQSMVTVLAVIGMENKRHYSARITVWELGGAYPQQVGKTFNGTYVDGGCFEDDPKQMVLQALHPVAN